MYLYYVHGVSFLQDSVGWVGLVSQVSKLKTIIGKHDFVIIKGLTPLTIHAQLTQYLVQSTRNSK